MNRTFLAMAAGLLAVCGVLLSPTTSAQAEGPIVPGSYGYDISYPQCPSKTPAGSFGFAIIGVNNGRAMTQNPCFTSQLPWARKGTATPAVYINSNSPPSSFSASACAPSDGVCRSFEYGRQAATYAMGVVNRAATDINNYWLDVETANTWSSNTTENAAVLRGMIEVLSGAGKYVGIYSTNYQFRLIAGNFSPGLDNWIPRPEAKRETAANFCRTTPSFGGGRIVMIQLWYEFDENYACPPQGSIPVSNPTTLKAGDTAIVTPGTGCLNLRAGTGVTFAIVECMTDGARVAVTGNPVTAGGYTWVPLRSPTGKLGWSAADYLVPAGAPQQPEVAEPPRPYRIFTANVAAN